MQWHYTHQLHCTIVNNNAGEMSGGLVFCSEDTLCEWRAPPRQCYYDGYKYPNTKTAPVNIMVNRLHSCIFMFKQIMLHNVHIALQSFKNNAKDRSVGRQPIGSFHSDSEATLYYMGTKNKNRKDPPTNVMIMILLIMIMTTTITITIIIVIVILMIIMIMMIMIMILTMILLLLLLAITITLTITLTMTINISIIMTVDFKMTQIFHMGTRPLLTSAEVNIHVTC